MTDTTIREAIADARTPATPKFLRPPTFNTSSNIPATFIRLYDQVGSSWSNYLVAFLHGAANVWYTEYVQPAPN